MQKDNIFNNLIARRELLIIESKKFELQLVQEMYYSC